MAAVPAAMDEIDATVETVLNRGQYLQEHRTARSRRNVYETALQEVSRIAGRQATEELARWIVADIHRDGRPPTARQVRRRGAIVCRDYGHPVGVGDWLGI